MEENSGKISSQNVHINRVTYLNIACRQLVDENRIKKSLVLPFRLIVAWKQLNSNDRHVRKMRNALEDAIDIACNNVPDLENTLVVVDNSGSK